MRILLITDNHSRTGGAEHYFFDLKNRLKKIPGFQVFSLGFGRRHESGEDYTIFKSLKTKPAKLLWQILFHPFMYYRLRKAIKKIHPDIIHIHNIKQYTTTLLYAIADYPVVQTIHDYGVICPTAHNIHKDYQACPTGLRKNCFWQHRVKYNLLSYLGISYSFFSIRKKLKKIVKHFFAPSPLLVSYLEQNQFTPATCVIPFKQDSADACFETLNPYHFLFAGNLGTHKGINLLLEEFTLAHQKNNQLTLTLVGAGPLAKSSQKEINRLGLEKNILLKGWKENLMLEYQECAAVIFPSIWLEAFGLIITEAMNHARPIIGSNRGSLPWLIDDKQTGLIFNPLIKGDLAEKILSLAGNKDLIMQFGQRGQEKLTTLIDNEKCLQQLIEVYEHHVHATR